jgi:hypothetical protein
VSNVLIGIIGVILFIGLALAGALFLGPRFQESTNNSRASAVVQAVSQVSNAANMYRVQEGTALVGASVGTVAGTSYVLKSDGYLKSIPSNPVYAAGGPALLAANGGTGTGTVATIVLMNMGPDAKNVCDAIIKQTGNGDSANLTSLNSTTLVGTAGCVKGMLNGNAGVQDGHFVAYSKL